MASDAATSEVAANAVGFWEILRVFVTIGVTSFGSGLSGWMHRECVERRRWVSEHEFVSGLAIAQAMPGLNVVNLAVWLGFRLRGVPGAVAGFAGVVVPPIAIVIAFALVYDRWGHALLVHRALAGVAAAAAALTLSVGVSATRVAARDAAAVVFLVVVFLGVGVFRLPTLLMVVVVAPISVALAFRAPADPADGR